MKCPHCGIYYTDGEKECPVCGKRPGIQAAKSSARKSSAGTSHKDVPHQPKKKPSAQSTERKQTYGNKSSSTETAWQQAAAGQHTHTNPLEPKQKTSGCGSGCLIILIVFILITAIQIIGAVGFNVMAKPEGVIESIFSSSEESAEDIGEDVDIQTVLTGTWRNSDGTLTLTIDEEGVVTWSDSDGIHSDDVPLFERLNLTEDNQEEYCSADELQDYPPDSFTYYSLYAVASEWDDDSELDMWFYLPQEEQSPEIFDYYDYYEEAYGTFTRVSDSTQPIPAGPEQTA